ncbi:MAG: cupin domain-containing protein [Caulobacterales bacterium]|nr:cupin domain-containing protein [Caulobacterales bacterium]
MGEATGRILRAADIAAAAFTFRHPLGGGDSFVTLSMLGRAAGLSRAGVNLARVPPGKEAFVHHRHHAEEEWVYILEGEAVSDIDDVAEPAGPGDFIAYPPGCAHSLRNVGAGDLVYLTGGEQTAVEIADFPRHGKRILRAGDRYEFMDEAAAEPFTPDIRPASEAADGPGDDERGDRHGD